MGVHGAGGDDGGGGSVLSVVTVDVVGGVGGGGGAESVDSLSSSPLVSASLFPAPPRAQRAEWRRGRAWWRRRRGRRATYLALALQSWRIIKKTCH